MDKKQRNFIMGKLRQLSRMYKERNDAKRSQKKGPAIFECAICGDWYYEGKKSLEKATEGLEIPTNVTVHVGKLEADHVVPVGTFDNWTDWIDRLFCNVEGWSYKCRNCHQEKTNKENTKRRSKKKVDK